MVLAIDFSFALFQDFYGAMAMASASGITFEPSLLPYGHSKLFPSALLPNSVDPQIHHLEHPPAMYHLPLLSMDLSQPPPAPPPPLKKLIFQDSYSPQSLSPANGCGISMDGPRFPSSGLHLTATSTPNRESSSSPKTSEFSSHSGIGSGRFALYK